MVQILREAIYQQEMKALSALSGEIEMDKTIFSIFEVANKAL